MWKIQTLFVIVSTRMIFQHFPGNDVSSDGHVTSDWLDCCSYFHVYPSVLFSDMKYSGTTGSTVVGWPNMHTFAQAAAKQWFNNTTIIQRENMSYSKVANVLRTTFTSTDLIEAEFKVLMNGTKLKITTSGYITNFRIVKLLYV